MTTERPIKILAKLPKGNANGLDTIYDEVRNHGAAYAVVRLVANEVVLRPGGTREPKLTIAHIEGLPRLAEGDNPRYDFSLAKQGERLLTAARARRTGEDEPGDMEPIPGMFDTDDQAD